MTQRPDDHRRKWDRSEYERLAQDRIRSAKVDDKEEERMFGGATPNRSDLKCVFFKYNLQLPFRVSSSSVATTKSTWTANWAKALSSAKPPQLPSPADTIATFATVSSRIRSTFSITSTARSTSAIWACR